MKKTGLSKCLFKSVGIVSCLLLIITTITTLAYSQVIQVEKPVHKTNPPVHQYIAFQALEVLKGTSLYSEMSENRGKCDTPYNQGNPQDDTGSLICEGAEEEDQWGDSGSLLKLHPFPDVPGDKEITYFTHFWNPNGGYTDGYGGYWSAIQKAQKYWSEKVIPYYTGDGVQKNTCLAYYWLGHVAHLLTDMSVPAHVHEDQHYEYSFMFFNETIGLLLGDDSYEEYMEGNIIKTDNYLKWNSKGLTPINYNSLSLSPDLKNCDYKGIQNWNEEKEWDKIALFKLFVNLAEKSDDYDSDDSPGEVTKGTLIYKNIIKQEYDINDNNCIVIGDDLMPLAMRYVASLYQLFWNATHFTISGYVKTSSGSGISGVAMTFSNGGGSTTTSSSGYYSREVSYGWSGTGTPSKTSYTFKPPSITYSNVTSNKSDQNYTGYKNPVISGYVKTSSGSGISSVTMTFSNGGGSTTTSSTGYYSKEVSYGWSGTVTPSKTSYTFKPLSITYSNVTSDKSNQNYTGTPPPKPVISGYVKISSGSGISSVTMTFSNGGGSTTTSSSGYYSKEVTFGWSGTVTPSKTGYTFNPSSKTYSNVTSNKTGENYTGNKKPVVSGYVKTSSGSGISSVTMTFSNSGGSTTTSSSGYYIMEVSSGWSGTVTPSKTSYTFGPLSKTYSNVTSDQSNQNYIGTLGKKLFKSTTEVDSSLYYDENEKVAVEIKDFKVVGDIPSEFQVSAPYPNPFNSYTSIRYQVPIDCHVELIIYDILGRKVSVLQNGKVIAGVHEAVWNGKNENGTSVGSGVYLYRLSADKYIRQGKITLMK